MNLCSQSKVKYSLFIAIFLVIVSFGISVIIFGFNLLYLLSYIPIYLILFYAYLHIRIIEKNIFDSNLTLKASIKGDFESRKIFASVGGPLEEMAHNINNFMDQLEYFIREIKVSISAASKNKY
jgi:methyl-accepting chemotaxis protein